MQAKKERVAPRLVSSTRVNEMLGLAGSAHIGQESLADILDGVGIEVAGSDGSGRFRWPEGAVEAALDRIKDGVKAWRAEQAAASLRSSASADLDAIERAVRSAVERYVTPAQQEIDESLKKLQEQQRGLFRLLGEVAEIARDTLRVANGVVKDVRSDNAALRMNLERRFDVFEGAHKEAFALVSDEIQTHTRCIAELRKALKP